MESSRPSLLHGDPFVTKPINVLDFEAVARERMTPSAYDYYAGGAEDEVTLAENRDAFRRIGAIKDVDTMVGGRTRAKVVKNKVAPPFREAEFDMMYGEGISREGDLIDQGVERNIIEKSGTWFSYGGERLGQGRENAKAFLKQNKEMAAAIEARLRKEMGLPAVDN